MLLGKTNTPQFGHKDSCDNLLGPPCRNPWLLRANLRRILGGRRRAVAAGLGPVAHGSDGGGSIRIPAALCGVVGMKPSFGRVPQYPSSDYWSARNHQGPLARTVRDAAVLLDAMSGSDPRDPLSIDGPSPSYLGACEGDLRGLRVVWSADLGYAPVDAEVRRIAEAARRSASPHWAPRWKRATPGWPDPGPFHKVLCDVANATRHGERASQRPDWIEPSLMRMVEDGRRVSGVEHAQASAQRSAFYDQAHRFFETCDLLLTPQQPVGAWPADPGSGPHQGPTSIGGRPTPSIFDRLGFTFPFNLTGHPAISVPCGFTAEGLPVGLQIVGRWHADALVLRAAAAFEALQPWAAPSPRARLTPMTSPSARAGDAFPSPPRMA